MQGWLAVMAWLVVAGCGRQGTDWKAEQEAAEFDRNYAAKREQEDEADERKRQRAEAEEAKARALEEEERAAKEPERSRLAALTEEAAGMTTAQRAARVRALCSPERCQQEDAMAVAAAAKTAAERDALERPIDAARARIETKLREMFARVYEEKLRKKGLGSGSFRAEGPKRTTFKASGWFCNEQFLDDMQKGEISKPLREAGFKRVVCDGPDSIWSGSL
jgi:hypothetical protein